MRTDSDQELFYAAVISRNLVGSKLFRKHPDGFPPIIDAIWNGTIQYNEVVEIIGGLLHCTTAHPNKQCLIRFQNLNIQRSANKIFIDFSKPSDTTIVSICATELKLLAAQLQYFVDICEDMKSKAITIENGFYSYWYRQGVNLPSLNRIFIHLISRTHQLQYSEVRDCWDLIRNDLIFNREFSFEMFEAMVNALGEYTATLEMLDREYETQHVLTDGKKYYRSLSGGTGGNSFGWDIANEETFSVYCLGSSSGSKTQYCSLHKIRTELENLLLRFYSIVDKERGMLP